MEFYQNYKIIKERYHWIAYCSDGFPFSRDRTKTGLKQQIDFFVKYFG